MPKDNRASYRNKSLMLPAARFADIGLSAKLIMGAVVIIATWLSLGLGFIALGLFLYLHLLLYQRPPVAITAPKGSVLAPLDGRLIAMRRDETGLYLMLEGQSVASQIIYAPLDATIEDKLWIDGAYLPFDDSGTHPLTARYDYLLQLEDGKTANFSLFCGPWTRFIAAPFSDGQSMRQAEPFGYGLLRSLVTIHLPLGYDAVMEEGSYCIAQQSCIAKRAGHNNSTA